MFYDNARLCNSYVLFHWPAFLTVWVPSSTIALFKFCVEKSQYIWTLRTTDDIFYFSVILLIIFIEQNLKYL